ncbi:hypothetical protein GW916_00725, partial [bacterium]|nr:hypothetical protein [bacterium]
VSHLLSRKKLIKIGELEGVKEEFFLTSTKRLVQNPVVEHIMKKFEGDSSLYETL